MTPQVKERSVAVAAPTGLRQRATREQVEAFWAGTQEVRKALAAVGTTEDEVLERAARLRRSRKSRRA